jgi:hypothetical protein
LLTAEKDENKPFDQIPARREAGPAQDTRAAWIDYFYPQRLTQIINPPPSGV